MTDAQSKMEEILELQRATQLHEGIPDLPTRLDRMDRAIGQLKKYRNEICAAASADFGGRGTVTSTFAEVLVPLGKFQHTRDYTRKWMQREKRPIKSEPGGAVEAWVEYQPLGVLGIIGPWNAPVNLIFSPMFGALSAGNRIMLKPSELTPRTSALIAGMIDEVFEPSEVAVFTGGPDVGAKFCRLPLDHLLFTGGAEIGKQIMKGAAENLVPVTLELGGKSPVIISRTADLEITAKKIIGGKLINAGQICLSPDYLLVPRERVEAMTQAATVTASFLYPTVLANEEYTSIINDRHFQRLRDYIDDARVKGANVIEVNPAGEDFSQQESTRKIPLHLLLDVNDDMSVMGNEIFGPLLPIMPYDNINEAISYVNAHPRPLALYYFGTDQVERDRVISRTVSGGVTVNDVMKHAHTMGVPFGGVGLSGMGAYQGFDGFKTFSHAKTVVIQPVEMPPPSPLSPPWDEKTRAALDQMLG